MGRRPGHIIFRVDRQLLPADDTIDILCDKVTPLKLKLLGGATDFIGVLRDAVELELQATDCPDLLRPVR